MNIHDSIYLKCLFFFLICVGTMSGCSMKEEGAVVRITPSFYEFSQNKSSLATPIVKDVAAIQPKKISIIVCRDTPPAKIIQFQKEISAKAKAELRLIVQDFDCS